MQPRHLDSDFLSARRFSWPELDEMLGFQHRNDRPTEEELAEWAAGCERSLGKAQAETVDLFGCELESPVWRMGSDGQAYIAWEGCLELARPRWNAALALRIAAARLHSKAISVTVLGKSLKSQQRIIAGLVSRATESDCLCLASDVICSLKDHRLANSPQIRVI